MVFQAEKYAIACYNTNRNFICCELDKNYYDKSIERLNKVKEICLIQRIINDFS